MASALQWLETARDDLRASVVLAEREHWRSAVSRAYYAAYHAAHAIVWHLDADNARRPRSLAHGELAGIVRHVLRRFPRLALVAEQSHLGLSKAYRLRVDADYKPQLRVGKDAYDVARTAANRLVRSAKELIE